MNFYPRTGKNLSEHGQKTNSPTINKSIISQKSFKTYLVDGIQHNYFCTPLSLVVPTGAVSNFLLEDFMAVLKFMDAEIQKKKLSLK
jgi:hypothetical protein